MAVWSYVTISYSSAESSFEFSLFKQQKTTIMTTTTMMMTTAMPIINQPHHGNPPFKGVVAMPPTHASSHGSSLIESANARHLYVIDYVEASHEISAEDPLGRA